MFSSIRSFTYSEGKISSASSHLILETPLEIVINGETSTLIMFTPGMTRELVTGFVFTEGFIDNVSDIEECIISSVGKEEGEEVIEAKVRIPSRGSLLTITKGTRTSYSSCGICGKDNYYDLKRGLGRVKSKHRFSMEVLKRLPESMEAYSPFTRRRAAPMLPSSWIRKEMRLFLARTWDVTMPLIRSSVPLSYRKFLSRIKYCSQAAGRVSR